MEKKRKDRNETAQKEQRKKGKEERPKGRKALHDPNYKQVDWLRLKIFYATNDLAWEKYDKDHPFWQAINAHEYYFMAEVLLLYVFPLYMLKIVFV